MSIELLVRICGVAGILSSLGMIVADILLYGRSDSFKSLPSLKHLDYHSGALMSEMPLV
jgi:hypothetical protein